MSHLEIYLDQEENVCMERINNDQKLLVFCSSLDRLESLGYKEAAYRTGGTVLDMLGLFYEQEFKEFKIFKSSHDIMDADYLSALELISLALSEKTSIHSASIEYLLKEASVDNEEARELLDSAWPYLKERLGKFANTGKIAA